MQEKSTGLSQAELLKQAADQLTRLVENGDVRVTESILTHFPPLAASRESVLELLYLEWIVRNERGDACSLTHFADRFPAYREDLAKLLEVDDAMRGAMADTPLHGSRHDEVSVISSHDTLSDRHPPAHFGTTRIGDYDVHGIVGRGGMGIVYRARQRQLDRLVALKTLDLIGSLNPPSVARFREEAELVARLQHPNIVQVFETGSHHGIPYYSMEFVEGGTLATCLREKSLKPAQSAKLIEVLARAIHYAHLQGIIHRDLKPANILLAHSSRPEALDLGSNTTSENAKARFEPKIVDFGLAKFLGNTSRQTMTGTAIGTPSYMPPEQLDPALGEVGPACDVYSLGAILFELLAGEPPFHGPTALDTMQLVRQEEAVFPKSLRQKVSSDLLLICQTCLRKEPHHRYASASDLADDLHRYLQGKPILARKATLFQRATKWARRHPSVTALLMLTTLFGIGLAGLWWRAEAKGTMERQQRVRGEHLIYARNIALAEFEFKANKLENCQKLLDDCQPSLRSWEWHYLSKQCEDAVWESPTSALPVMAVAISRDGRMVAKGNAEWGTDRQQPIEVWDLDSGQKKWSLDGHPAGVYDLAFSPDGRWLASAGVEWGGANTGSVQLWNMDDGSRRTLTQENAYVVRFHPDGDSIYAGLSSGVIKEYSSTTGKALGTLTGLRGFVTDLAFEANGKFLTATSRKGSLLVWDRETRKGIESLFDLGDLRRVAWHPDGKKLLVSSYSGDLSTYEWEGSRLKWVHTQAKSSVPIVRYSPDGLHLALAVFGEGAQLLDAKTGKVDRVLRRHNGHVNAMAFDGSGMRLATGGNDGAVRVWDLTEARTSVAIDSSRREKILVMASNPAKSELALAIANDSRNPLTDSSSRIELLDLATGKVRKDLRGNTGVLTSIAFNPAGDRLIAGGQDAKVHVWDTQLSKPLLTFTEHKTAIVGLAMMQNNLALSVDRDGEVRVWEVASQRVVRSWKGATSPVVRIAVDEAGTRLCLLDDNCMATLWDIASGEPKGARQLPPGVTELKLAWHARQVAIGDATGKIDLWDLDRFSDPKRISPSATLTRHTASITSLNYNPSGDRLVSCSSDESIRLIDTQAGCEVFELDRAKGRVPLALFSSDGKQITRADGANLWHWNGGETWKQSLSLASKPPQEAAWYRKQIERATDQRAWRIAERYRSRLLEMEPEKEDLYYWRGVIRLRLQDWEGAESDFRKAHSLQANLRNQYELARLLLLRGKREEYRQACEKLFSDTVAALRRNENYALAWVSCLSPDSGVDPRFLRTMLDGSKVVNNPVGALLKAVPLLENAMEIPGADRSVKDFETWKELDTCVYALVCYRTGDYDLAMKHAIDATRSEPQAAHLPNLIRALCLAKKGKKAEAKRVLALAKAQRQRLQRQEESGIELSAKLLSWNDLEYPLLLEEAERTLAAAEVSQPLSK